MELNQLADVDSTVDEMLKASVTSMARKGDPVIIDSRLAFYFLPSAIKLHFLAHPVVAATRVFARQGANAEAYPTLSAAEMGVRRRAEIERARYLRKYGADIGDLKQYDFVVQTDTVDADEVFVLLTQRLESSLKTPVRKRPELWMNPRSVVPLDILVGTDLLNDLIRAEAKSDEIRVIKSGELIFSLGGESIFLAALDAKAPFVRASLLGRKYLNTEGLSELSNRLRSRDFRYRLGELLGRSGIVGDYIIDELLSDKPRVNR
jgi:cytidylate kinase